MEEEGGGAIGMLAGGMAATAIGLTTSALSRRRPSMMVHVEGGGSSWSALRGSAWSSSMPGGGTSARSSALAWLCVGAGGGERALDDIRPCGGVTSPHWSLLAAKVSLKDSESTHISRLRPERLSSQCRKHRRSSG